MSSPANYVHFKCTKDEAMKPIDIAKHLFLDTHKSMVVLHPKSKKNAPPHWHFQGVLRPSLTHKDFDNYLNEISKNHAMKQLNKAARPCKRNRKQCDDLGFQYMIRHGLDSCIHSTGFSPEDLEALVAGSVLYVEEMQADGYVYLSKNLVMTGTPAELHRSAKRHIFHMYLDKDKMMPPNVSKLVVYWLCKLCKDKQFNVSAMADYISDKFL